MSGLADVLVVLAVVALIVVRQIRPQRLAGTTRWWAVPAVLAVIALREPALIDTGHRATAVLLLVAELATGILVGAAWAWTSRVWTEPDGSVWMRGTKATAAAWGVGIALRAGLAGLGVLLGIHQGEGTLLLSLAVSLLVRSGVLAWRAQSVSAVPVQGTVYDDDTSSASRKDPV